MYKVPSIPKQLRCNPELLDRHCAYVSLQQIFEYFKDMPAHRNKAIFKKPLNEQTIDVHTDGNLSTNSVR